MPNDALSRAPWPYGIGIPQRFTERYERYQQLGGLVDITEDARAYAGAGPLRDAERLVFLSLVFDQIHKEGLEGDFVELGVYQGDTAAVLARHARRLGRQIFLLDTFGGFDSEDMKGVDAGRSDGEFADTSLDAVRARVGEQGTSFIKGYFPQSADQLPADGRYCLVHIDADLYAPILSGLEYFYPRMVPGGFMIIHDYSSLIWEGAERAVDTFFADKPEGAIPVPDASGSVVIRRLRPADGGPTWRQRRAMLALDTWHSAANGNLTHVLTDGWSVPEAWGTWGVGPSHMMTLMVPPEPAEQGYDIDVDLHALAWNPDVPRQIEVVINGTRVTWFGVPSTNNFKSISFQSVRPLTNGILTVEFRPCEVVAARDVVAGSQDARTLGVGLHRIRIRATEPSRV